MFLYYLITTSEILDLKSEIREAASDNSHYSIIKELKPLSTKCRNFSAQSKTGRSTFDASQTDTIKPADVTIGNQQSAISLVEARGFEPLTPALQTRCSAS